MASPTDAEACAAGAAAALETRVFVGGLPAEATERDLLDRFGRFVADGESSVALALELAPSKAPWASADAHRGVAFLTLSGAGAGDARDRLVKTFNRTKWRGSVLRVEPARPHYLERLRLEWQAQRAPAASAAAATTATSRAMAAPSYKPMRVAVAFAGKRRKTFEDVEERPLESEAADLADEGDDGGSTSQDDESGDEQEGGSDSDSGSASDTDGEVYERAESEDEDAQHAVGEDDVEQFVRQMEAEAASAEAATPATSVSEEDARAEANARRVAALAARQQLRQQKQEEQRRLVAAAVSTGAARKKITFDDDGEAQEHHEDTGDASRERLVTDWLDSDSDSEDEDEAAAKAIDPEDRELLAAAKNTATLDFVTDKEREAAVSRTHDIDVAKAFALRPEFLGEGGKRLFEMQKRFGGDQRFRLDARFMEEDEFAAGNDELAGEEDAEAADRVDGELQTFLDEDGRDDAAAHERAWQAEQDAALAAIEKLFPDLDVAKIKHRLRVQGAKDPVKEAAWMGRMKRYDPRDASSRLEFELAKEDATGTARGRSEGDVDGDDAAMRRKAERESKPVLVGGDRFFATSNRLGSLFTRVRKNSEDGMEGEAALDGVFGAGKAESGDASGADGAGAAAFKLSSLFAFPVEDEKQIAAMGESLLEQDDEHEERSPSEPWHFARELHDGGDAPEGEEEVETDGEADDAAADEQEAAAKTRRSRSTRSLEDFLAFGSSFLRDDRGDSDANEWAERRKRLTLDFKRKRRDALKSKKKQQQQFAKHKKPRRA